MFADWAQIHTCTLADDTATGGDKSLSVRRACQRVHGGRMGAELSMGYNLIFHVF
jgi:hypothetical protein